MNDKIDMKTIFIDKMGVDYERLEKFAFMVFMCFSKETQDAGVLKLKDIGKKEEGSGSNANE